MKKRIVSLLMALCMTVSLMTTVAFAAGNGEAPGNELTALTQEAVKKVFGDGNASIAPGTSTITLNNDVVVKKNITLNVDCTLDLNGNTLKSGAGENNSAPYLTIGSNRTVEIIGSGTVEGGNKSDGSGYVAIQANAGSSLTIGEDVTVQGGNGENGKGGGYTIVASGKCLTVHGTVKGGNGGAGGDNSNGYPGSGAQGIFAFYGTPTIDIKPTGKVYGGKGGDSTVKPGGFGGSAISNGSGTVVTATVEGSIIGGNGGNGGTGNVIYTGGDGWYAVNAGANITFKNGGSIRGGNGSNSENGTGGRGGAGLYAYASTITVTADDSSTISGGNGGSGGSGTPPGADGKVSEERMGGEVTVNGENPNKPEDPETPDPAEQPKDSKPDPTDNEANTAETTEKLAGAKAGDSVAVKLVSGSADLSVSTMNALGATGKNTNLTLTVSDGLVGGTAEIVIPGGFGKITEPGRFSYPMNFRAKAEDNDDMLKAVKGGSGDGAGSIIAYTMRIGANMTLPTAATITLKTPAPHGTALNIYKYDEHAKKFILLGKATAKDGKLSFSTKELGQMLLTTGTV